MLVSCCLAPGARDTYEAGPPLVGCAASGWGAVGAVLAMKECSPDMRSAASQVGKSSRVGGRALGIWHTQSSCGSSLARKAPPRLAGFAAAPSIIAIKHETKARSLPTLSLTPSLAKLCDAEQ